MIQYMLTGHFFNYEVQTTIQVFYPNRNYFLCDVVQQTGITIESILTDAEAIGCLYIDGQKIATHTTPLTITDTDVKDLKMAVKRCLFVLLKEYKHEDMPWGALTGIRPTKRVFELWRNGATDEQILKLFQESYYISPEKSTLCVDVAHREHAILQHNHKKKVALYVGIPFCPTKCLYCSFTSYSLEQHKHFVGLYLDALAKELEAVAQHIEGYEIESIYIGGGTPTSLNEAQLERLLIDVTSRFHATKEFTVEAGRPDTLNHEKLSLLKQYGATRISINPQTLNEKTLPIIGRDHTVQQFFDTFEAARAVGHQNINVDLILGLPGETKQDVAHTLERLRPLAPESITVHTLAIKRASQLKQELDQFSLLGAAEMEEAIELTKQYAAALGLYPYYMYRQKNMLGNFENVGYAKEGFESVYNVQIMEETQTIFAVGAGATSKIFYADENRLERIFNVKDVRGYIDRIDEMIERKKGELQWT